MTSRANDRRPDGVVASMLAAWLETPDVLADPYQVGSDSKVWTRAQDILPGRRVVEGHSTVAVWEDLTWRAMPCWDPEDLDVLWLRPLGSPTEVPDPANFYEPSPHREPAPGACTGDTADGAADQGRHECAAVVTDFQQSVRLLIETVRTHRKLAQDLLAELAALPTGHRRRVLSSPAGHALLALARRTGPPER